MRKQNRNYGKAVMLVIGTMLISACGNVGETGSSGQSETDSAQVEETPEASEVAATPEPTAVPEATETPEPEATAEPKDGWETVGSDQYWYQNGEMATGWCTIEDSTYYFDPVDGHMEKGQVDIEGKTYQFNENTGIYEGEWVDVYFLTKESSDQGDWHEYKYDSNGNLNVDFYYAGGDESGGYISNLYGYDEYGNETSYVQTFVTPGQPSWEAFNRKYENEYDAQGRRIKMIMYSLVNSEWVQDTSQYEYEYDEQGNLAKRIWEFVEGPVVVRVEEYDTNGNKVKETSYSSVTGVQVGSIEYEYDEYGGLVKESGYSAEVEPYEYTYENEYDENGNRIKTTAYAEDGSVRSVTQYEYEAVRTLKVD